MTIKYKVNVRVLIGAAIILAGILLLVKFFIFPVKSVPIEFSDARLKGAKIARQIVILANNTIKSLETIAEYDKQGNTADALILISNQLLSNRDSQEAAIKLSSQLEHMARNAARIKPSSARQAAMAAITAEVALVSHLISYNDYLKQLLEVLRLKLTTTKNYSDTQVEDLIGRMNEEAQAINDFDRRFNQALAEFDKIILN